MKTKSITLVSLMAMPLLALAQPNPATPPSPPAAPQGAQPPAPPPPPPPPSRHGDRDREDKRPKVPVTYLGVETSPVPSVVCEQLGLPKGFGLVVDYVVPDGPAAAAGVQQNDILRMINDQILMEPGQLSKLVRSYSDGTTVTLTVLRKGQEQKIPVKLAKKEVPQPRDREFGPRHGMDFGMGDMDFGKFGPDFEQMTRDITESNQDVIRKTVAAAQEAAERAREQGELQREKARELAERAREQGRRIGELAREEAQRAAEQMRMTLRDGNGLTTTRIDLGKAQIVFSDDKGELRLEKIDGKKVLTAKDPQGRLLFSGPVETKEEIDKVPAEVRQRFEQLQKHDLPAISAGEEEEENDMDSDENDSEQMEQASARSVTAQSWPLPFRQPTTL